MLDRGVANDQIFGQGECLVQASDRFREIQSQRFGFCHSAFRCSATYRNLSETPAKSTTSIV